MVDSIYYAEAAFYAAFTALHLYLTIIQVRRLRNGHYPTLLSVGALVGSMAGCAFEVARAIDPSAVFGIYNGPALAVFTTSASTIIFFASAHVVFESIATLFHEVVDDSLRPSKGLNKIFRIAQSLCLVIAISWFLMSILVLARDKQVYLGVFNVVFAVCWAGLATQISVGGRWLRRRLRKEFKKLNVPMEDINTKVSDHLLRLTFFRYSFFGLTVVVSTITTFIGIDMLLSPTDSISRPNKEAYSFIDFAVMWLQMLIMFMFMYLGWAPAPEEASSPMLRTASRQRLKVLKMETMKRETLSVHQLAGIQAREELLKEQEAKKKKLKKDKTAHRHAPSLTTEQFREEQAKKIQSSLRLSSSNLTVSPSAASQNAESTAITSEEPTHSRERSEPPAPPSRMESDPPPPPNDQSLDVVEEDAEHGDTSQVDIIVESSEQQAIAASDAEVETALVVTQQPDDADKTDEQLASETANPTDEDVSTDV